MKQTNTIHQHEPTFNHERLSQLLRAKDRQSRLKLAQDSSASLDILVELSKDIDPEIRASVACNSATPQELVEGIANSNDNKVKIYMASSPNLPLKILQRLVEDKNLQVRDRAKQTLDGIILESELEEENFFSLPGIKSRLGELLSKSNVITEEEIEKALLLSREINIPLGRTLVQLGRVDRQIVIYALKLQTMIRLGQATPEMAIQELRKYAGLHTTQTA